MLRYGASACRRVRHGAPGALARLCRVAPPAPATRRRSSRCTDEQDRRRSDLHDHADGREARSRRPGPPAPATSGTARSRTAWSSSARNMAAPSARYAATSGRSGPVADGRARSRRRSPPPAAISAAVPPRYWSRRPAATSRAFSRNTAQVRWSSRSSRRVAPPVPEQAPLRRAHAQRQRQRGQQRADVDAAVAVRARHDREGQQAGRDQRRTPWRAARGPQLGGEQQMARARPGRPGARPGRQRTPAPASRPARPRPGAPG